MISAYFREQKRYSQKELQKLLECSDNELVNIVRKFKEYGILKAVKASDIQRDMSDLIEEDIEVAEVNIGETDYYYVFTFVGVITAFGRIIKCYPKYINNKENPKEELRQIIKVLEKYNSKHQIIRMYNDTDETKSFNLLAVLLFLLQDYFENGEYKNYEDIVEVNGDGEILWERTINESFVFLSSNRPIYIELQTKRRVLNDHDFFKRLHECVLTLASKELKETDLLDIFELPEIDLSDESLDDFGDNEYILYRLSKEIAVQFNTRKQLVLKTLYAYIAHTGHLLDIDCLSMFGTNSFNLVWENVCSEIMDNQLHAQLGSMKLPVKLDSKYNGLDVLLDIIEKPLWSYTNHRASDTLIPDLITTFENNGKYYFVIFDAKYYNPLLEPNTPPKGQPGIESVVKQYLYQLAYQDFISVHHFDQVINCFLIPSVGGNELISKDYVELSFLKRKDLENIQVRLLPATLAYEYYLKGGRINLAKMLSSPFSSINEIKA